MRPEIFLPQEYLKIVQFLKKKQDAWRPVFLYDTIRRAVEALSAGVVQTCLETEDPCTKKQYINITGKGECYENICCK